MPQNEEAKGIFRLVLKCALFAFLVAAVILALASLLVTGGLLPPERIIVSVFIAEAVGAFVGGKIASRRAESRKMPVAALTGICLFVLLLVVGLLFSFPPARHALLILPAAVLPAMAGALEKPKTRRGVHR